AGLTSFPPDGLLTVDQLLGLTSALDPQEALPIPDSRISHQGVDRSRRMIRRASPAEATALLSAVFDPWSSAALSSLSINITQDSPKAATAEGRFWPAQPCFRTDGCRPCAETETALNGCSKRVVERMVEPHRVSSAAPGCSRNFDFLHLVAYLDAAAHAIEGQN